MCFSRTSHYHYLVILTSSVCQVILINVYFFVCLFVCFKFSGVNLIIVSNFPFQLAGEKTLSLPQWNSSLCDPVDGSTPGSPIPEILQARTLEWVDISFSNA